MIRTIIRVVGYFICCLLFVWGIAAMVIGIRGDRPNGRFDSGYAPGATANSVEKLEGIGTVVFGATLTLCSAMALIAREIVVAINGVKAEIIASRNQDKRSAQVPAQPIALPQAQPPMPAAGRIPKSGLEAERPLGQLPGESLEAWAKRTEQAELAAFKARSKA